MGHAIEAKEIELLCFVINCNKVASKLLIKHNSINTHLIPKSKKVLIECVKACICVNLRSFSFFPPYPTDLTSVNISN
jgi:hypothetical protein